MTKWTLRCVVLCGLLLASASLQAHHSLAGVYALGKEAKVSGAFKAFRFVNPHSSMKLDVKNADGTITEWSFVGGSVTASRGSGSARPDRMPSSPGIQSPSRACRRRTARVRSGCCRDHLPGRAHGPFPVPRRVDGGVAGRPRWSYRGRCVRDGERAIDDREPLAKLGLADRERGVREEVVPSDEREETLLPEERAERRHLR